MFSKVSRKYAKHSSMRNVRRAYSNQVENIQITINKKKHEIKLKDLEDPNISLLQYLRKTGLSKATKNGCSEGGCGACVVMDRFLSLKTHKVKTRSVNSCLVPVLLLDGHEITTAEHVPKDHLILRKMDECHGTQCGYCTPGFVMSMYTTSEIVGKDTKKEELLHNLDGNLCRCTGYLPILHALEGIEKERESIVPEPIDRSLLSLNRPVNTEINGIKWLTPLSIQEVAQLKSVCVQKNKKWRIINGNTEVGIETNILNNKYQVLINSLHVSEMHVLEQQEDGLLIGSNMTLSTLGRFFKKKLQVPEYARRTFDQALDMLQWFASTPIRNVASVGGNICNASPISDLNPLWAATRGYANVINSKNEQRKIPLDEFFLGYRKTALKDDEILVSVFIPYTAKNEYIECYKQARRREDDIAIVNAAIRVVLDDNDIITDLSISYGGVAPYTINAKETAKSLIGKKWDRTLDYEDLILDEIKISKDAPPGMVEYRKSLMVSFFKRFHLSTLHRIHPELVDAKELSAFRKFDQPFPQGVIDYEVDPRGTSVGQPIPHLSGHLQVSGEATYVDDIPTQFGELQACLITSTKPHALLHGFKNLDKVLETDGVIDVITSKDIPEGGKNLFGPGGIADEELLATDKVKCYGQIIGAVVAKTATQARDAVAMLEVDYEELPPIFSIEEAIEKDSYLGTKHVIETGDIDEAFKDADVIVEGKVNLGGQEHFYLEPQGVLVTPLERDELIIHSSTQGHSHTQHAVSELLNRPQHKIVSKGKRIGGGFGGKETRSIIYAGVTSVAANKLKRPIRLIVPRQTDMETSGTRHPFMMKYKAAAKKDGTILGADIQIYNNAGWSADLSQAVCDRALFHSDNSYLFKNMRVTGRVARTNTPSNTAFRAFGGQAGMFIADTLIDHLAFELNMHSEKVRRLNLYKKGDFTHYGQQIKDTDMGQAWEECRKMFNFDERVAKAKEFNSKNQYKKRGIAMVPSKFGISFTATFLNQAGALINVYEDGSILLHIGGVEMGQGLYTKCAQTCASALNVSVDKIFISETSTDKTPNQSPTAASAGSDLCGGAVINACELLNERLRPLYEKNKEATWEEIVHEAYLNRINLSAQGFYKTEGINMDWETGKGSPFKYFTSGVSACEVEIDCLTGDHTVLSANIAMDVGRSLNPAIDGGQILGAWAQGAGLFSIEEIVIGDNEHPWVRSKGKIQTNGPGFYKIPAFQDVPKEFNVKIIPNIHNEGATYGSRGIGEPPLYLGSSVLFAIKDAIQSTREDQGISGHFTLDAPATAERIRMACTDSIVQRVLSDDNVDFKTFRPKGSY